LFDAFMTLKRDDPRLRLKVVGPFEPQDFQVYQQIARTNQVTGIEFVGYVSPERLPKIYHEADIFCAPSLGNESFGIVLLEAMAAGLPIVASDIAGYRSILTAGQEGLLTVPGQARSLAQALRQLIDNPHQRRTMGQQGQLKARQFSWDRVIEKILDVYLTTIHHKIRIHPISLDYVNPKIYLSQKRSKPEGKSC
jgi:phosphatidylinositol alpha-mannosyltransferase